MGIALQRQSVRNKAIAPAKAPARAQHRRYGIQQPHSLQPSRSNCCVVKSQLALQSLSDRLKLLSSIY